MSPSYDRRRDLVGENQHRPGDTTFPISNWAILTFLTGLHMPQRTDFNMGFHISVFLLLMNYLSSKKLWSLGILTHGTCSQPEVELCPENFGEWVTQNIWVQRKNPNRFVGPTNKALGTRKSKMWAVLAYLTMCVAGCPFLHSFG